MLRAFLILISFFFITSLQAQENSRLTEEDKNSIKLIEDTLGVLAFTIVNDSLSENRFAAVRKFIPTLVKALKHDFSYDYSFERLQSISIQTAPDNSFRIFTWQLYVDVNEYRYYGAIQMNDEKLKLYPLQDRSFEINGNLEQLMLKPDRWYGSVYYNLKSVDIKGQAHYLLFGYDRNELFRKRKILDVLTFTAEGPVFGAPIIPLDTLGKNFKHRLILEYSAEAVVRLNYDEVYNMIVFDHLIPMNGKYDEGLVNIPDGSYEGFVITKKGLERIEKVFSEISEEAPRPFPVLNTKRGNQN